MQQFVITLKNDKSRQYDRIALYIILINVFVFIFLAVYAATTAIRISTILGASLIIIFMLMDYFLKANQKKKELHYYIASGFIIFFTWLFLGYWWMAAVILLLGLLFNISQRLLVVDVSVTSVSYPSFPKKHFRWDELSNVIIKDGMLTIDCKNNKLIQQFIDEKKSAVNELKFNDFCRAQLIK